MGAPPSSLAARTSMAWKSSLPAPILARPHLSCTSSSKKPAPPSNFPHCLFSLFLYVRRDLPWPSSSCPWRPFPPAPPAAPRPAVASGLSYLARALLIEDPQQGTIVASPGSCSPSSSCAHGTFPCLLSVPSDQQQGLPLLHHATTL
jgi:hypothetical protein